MNKQKKILTAAIAGVIVLGGIGTVTSIHAAQERNRNNPANPVIDSVWMDELVPYDDDAITSKTSPERTMISVEETTLVQTSETPVQTTTTPVQTPASHVRTTETPVQTTTPSVALRLSRDQAVTIALAQVPGADSSHVVEFGHDDDEIEIEIYYNGTEYDFEIHPYSGKILKMDVERDDNDDWDYDHDRYDYEDDYDDDYDDDNDDDYDDDYDDDDDDYDDDDDNDDDDDD